MDVDSFLAPIFHLLFLKSLFFSYTPLYSVNASVFLDIKENNYQVQVFLNWVKIDGEASC